MPPRPTTVDDESTLRARGTSPQDRGTMDQLVRDRMVAKNERGTAASPPPPAKPPEKVQAVQLGFAGLFPADYADDAQRRRLQTARIFYPDTQDFINTLKQGKHTKKIERTPTLGKMLDQIMSQPDGSISRIDLITHASPGQVGLKGRVVIKELSIGGYTSHVFFDADGRGDLDISNLQTNILEEIAKDEGTQEMLQKARRKFAKNAELHVYACNSGISSGRATPLVQVVANLFGVQSFMFTAEMGYTLKADGTWGYHLRYTIPGRLPSDLLVEKTAEVTDYRDLDKMTQLIVSASPAGPVTPARPVQQAK